MDEKVINFNDKAKLAEIYCNVADVCDEKGDYLGELSAFFSALKVCTRAEEAEILADIADVYAQMELYELSNRFWFYCIDKKTAAGGDLSEAYSELAANFYCMDDVWAAGFYLALRAEIQGALPNREADEEILNAVYEESNLKTRYWLAYPFERADYSEAKKRGKRSFAAGGYGAAAAAYESIPEECRDEDSFGELAMAYFFLKKDEKAIAVSREAIRRLGDNLTAYCNLSTIYGELGDDEKSDYYYGKALSLKSGAKDEDFKIASCAIERGDHITARDCLSRALKDRPYDVLLKFFYAIALLNLGEYEKAVDVLFECVRISPDDGIFLWFAELAVKIRAGDKKSVALLPLKYEKELPHVMAERYEQAFSDALNGKKTAVPRREILLAAKVAAHLPDEFLAKTAILTVCELAPKAEAENFLKKTLLNPSVGEEIKSFIIYLLVVHKNKDKTGIVVGKYYVNVKLRRLPFDETDEFGAKFIAAYAACVSSLAFTGIEDTDKALFALNRLYGERAEEVRKANLQPNELAAVAVVIAKYEKLNKMKLICQIFGAKSAKVEKFLNPDAFARSEKPAHASETASSVKTERSGKKNNNENGEEND